MDLYIEEAQVAAPPTHYESIVFNENTNILIDHVKKTAFYYMGQLEGWCTNNKAAFLIDLVFMTNAKIVVEIGVWGGKSLIPMAYALKASSKGTIYGIDPWDNLESVEGMDGANYEWWLSVNHRKILEGLKTKISEFDLTEQIELVRTTSEKAEPISNIDILHIDGNHSKKAAMLDVTKWVPLVRKGGFIIFDDVSWGDNATAVEWLDAHCIRIAVFREFNEWGIWLKP